MNRKEFEEFKEKAIKRGTDVKFEGETYYCKDAYCDNYNNENAMIARGYKDDEYTSFDDDDDEMTPFTIIWKFIDKEDLEDCADWENPKDVIRG